MCTDAKWTFMVYMAGDNNLSDAGDTDMDEMCKVGSSPDVNILVQFDNEGNFGTRRFLVQKSARDVLQSLGETDSGDPNVLLDFISWVKSCYPARRYALILWNHGGGWEPSEIDTIAQQVERAHTAIAKASNARPLRCAVHSFAPPLRPSSLWIPPKSAPSAPTTEVAIRSTRSSWAKSLPRQERSSVSPWMFWVWMRA